MEVMSEGIGPSPTSPATLCPFPEEHYAAEEGVLTGCSGCCSGQGALPGEETSQACPRYEKPEDRPGGSPGTSALGAVHMCLCV